MLCLIERWEKYKKEKEKYDEDKKNDKLYKEWGIERVNLDENLLANKWSEEEAAELGHS